MAPAASSAVAARAAAAARLDSAPMSSASSRKRPRAGRAPGRAQAPAKSAAFALHGAAGVPPEQERLLVRAAWALAALLGVALLVFVFGPHRVGDYMTETDFYGQYAAGARLVQHGHLDPMRYGVVGPGYEIALALVGFVVPNLFLAAGLLSVAASVATLLLWFALLRRRVDARAGLAAMLLVAVNAFFFRYGYAVTTDALAVALQAAALFVLLARPGPRAAPWAGLLAALAFLTRYNAVYLVPAGLVALLAGGTPQERRGRAAWLFALGFLAPVVPWVLYSLARGSGFSFQLHHNIAYEVFAHARGITWDDYQRTMQPQFHSLADVIARDPGAVAARMAFNVFDHLRQDAASLLRWPVALCAALGLLLGLADGSARRLWPLWLAMALLFLTLVPAFYSERYSLALLPGYAAAAGLLFASPRFALAAGRARKLWLKPALLAIPVAVALVATVRAQARLLTQLPLEVLPAARTLKALARPGDRVIARKPHIAWHAGLEPVPFPFADSLPQLADYARREGARWLFFSWPEGETRPRFWYLLDTTAVVPGLTPHPVMKPHPAVLYEIGPAFGTRPAWLANDTLYTLHEARGQLAVDPRYGPALRSLGSALVALGRLDEALDAYRRAAQVMPDNAALQLALGRLSVRLGDFEGGGAAFARAAALDPSSVDARVGLGWAAWYAGRRQEAAGVWRPVVARTRDSDTLKAMIELYDALGDRETADLARRALAAAEAGR